MSRGLFGAEASPYDEQLGNLDTLVAVPIPWAQLTVLGGGGILVCAALTALSLVFLKTSTDPSELRAAA